MLPQVSFHGLDPVEPPIQIIYQHVPYGPRSIREGLFPRLDESEVSFLYFALFELEVELASLEAASCEKECAGRVLGPGIAVNGGFFSLVSHEVTVLHKRWREGVPCQGGVLATVPPAVQTAVSPLL